jgi:hypothetical protein
VLASVFFAGTSAGSLGQLLCWHLWNGLDIESHQAMRAHATGNQISLEAQDRLKRKPGRAHRAIGQQLDAVPVVLDCAFFQPNQNDAVGQILWANDRQDRPFIFEQIANPDLDLSIRIAQRHAIPSRLITVLRYRQLYTFQNQFISLMRISCLRDAREGTAVSRFGSISCPRPVVLRQLAFRALGSAPADRLRWRDGCPMTEDQKRFVKVMRAECSGHNLKSYLDETPAKVNTLLCAIFRRNHFTQQEREAIGERLQMTLTTTARRPSQQRNQANGGLPKTKGANV